ncbi:uncharacterized protein LOC119588081 [Penaeus monodon]|uniref:uncharacterized protein LOC119588081 n=1 Tax=Penaeus monodon TaxID=6687 RepID=UPI0018A70E0B|nr:uncharacterized protein LOC119588081 [Penaeus monodon]
MDFGQMTRRAQRPKQTPAMDEQETVICSTKIYREPGDCRTPLVQLTCRGKTVTFLVDTGCYKSSLTSRQKAILGYDDEMWKKDEFQDLITSESLLIKKMKPELNNVTTATSLFTH